jgi:hypothetical protein
MNLASKPLFIIEVDVATPVSVGDPGDGVRRYVPLIGGRPTGAITGKVLPGADWQTLRLDGAIDIAAHYALETESGDRIEVMSNGVRTAPPDIAEKLAHGEAVDPALYYFRTAMRFRTGAKDLERLNHVLAIALGERHATMVRLHVHEIL